MVATGIASAQLPGSIQIEPFPPIVEGKYKSKPEVHIRNIQNYYGTCGDAVVQVLGVEENPGDEYYTVDAGSDTAQIVILNDGEELRIKQDDLSDANGIACLNSKKNPQLLVWKNCIGSCSPDFHFIVVDIRSMRIIRGGKTECDATCAFRATGSRLPFRLNHRSK
jgi:hypothetical protein